MIRDDLVQLCNGNIQAVQFIDDFWQFMQAWDDVIDRDKPPDDDATNRAILWALFGMRDDPFYNAFPAMLRASVQQAVSSWLLANKFEKSKQRPLVEQAYFLRCSAYDVFAVVALLAGGPIMHDKMNEYLRRLAPEDTLASYMREHMGD